MPKKLMTRYIAAAPLLIAAMSAQNAPSMNNARHLDIPAISRKANGSIVSIVMSDKDGHPLAQGSGFLVTKNGRVVTNYHVIKNGASAVIKLPTGAFFAVVGVLAFDKEHDVAVIKAHGSNFQTVVLGDSDRLQVGEEVVAIGSPLSLESTVSNGIVSGIRSDDGRRLLQITAPISHGSSGGPLFNLAGEVIGITTAALVGGENLNFAVPINDGKKLLALPATQALVAFPNEPEATAVAPEGSAPTDGSPSLEEAEQWMTKFTVAYARLQHSRTILEFNRCEVTEHDFLGENLDHEGPLEQSNEIHGTSYALADVDPKQISVSANAMAFANTNAKLSINHSGMFYSAEWFVIFDNPEHANQFAKAFKHAVGLCGGKASAF